jgi:hypothetical protein
MRTTTAIPHPNKKVTTMFRYIKYLPVIIPVVRKFLRSPQGQKALAKARTLLQSKPSGPRR